MGKKSKAVRIDIEAFNTLSTNRGMTYEKLEELTGLSARTFSRIQAGQSISFQSMAIIAAVFKVPHETLLYGFPPYARPEPPKTIRSSQVQVRINTNLSDMNETKQKEIRVLLKKVIGATADVTIQDVKGGSTILFLELTEGDLLRFLAAMVDNELGVLGITKITFCNYTWLMNILALLEFQKGQWRALDAEGLEELKYFRAYDEPCKLRTQNCIFCKDLI